MKDTKLIYVILQVIFVIAIIILLIYKSQQ